MREYPAPPARLDRLRRGVPVRQASACFATHTARLDRAFRRSPLETISPRPSRGETATPLGLARRGPVVPRRRPLRTQWRWPLALLALLLVAAFGTAAIGGPSPAVAKPKHPQLHSQGQPLHFELNPTQDAFVAQNGCMPGGTIDVTVRLATDQVGSDSFAIQGRNLVPNQEYTIFLLQSAVKPVGAAQYIGDLSTNAAGNGQTTLQLIVEEAFASANGDPATVIPLDRIGVWFADPAADDGCAVPSPTATTIFDGDGEAGIQAFNSANAGPLP